MVGIGYPVASHTRATFFPILSLAFSGPETITGAEKMYSYYGVKLGNNSLSSPTNWIKLKLLFVNNLA